MAAKLAFVAVLALALVRRSSAFSTKSLTMSTGRGAQAVQAVRMDMREQATERLGVEAQTYGDAA